MCAILRYHMVTCKKGPQHKGDEIINCYLRWGKWVGKQRREHELNPTNYAMYSIFYPTDDSISSLSKSSAKQQIKLKYECLLNRLTKTQTDNGRRREKVLAIISFIHIPVTSLWLQQCNDWHNSPGCKSLRASKYPPPSCIFRCTV